MKDHPKIRLFNVINGIIFILISIIMLIPIYKVLVDSFDLSSAYGMRLWPKQFGPVSYTHLDVYKRQVSDLPFRANCLLLPLS